MKVKVKTKVKDSGAQHVTAVSGGTAPLQNLNPIELRRRDFDAPHERVILTDPSLSNPLIDEALSALSSPRILWNSGIGRSDALNIVKSCTSGVSLPDSSEWIELPVGHNLKDHAQVPLQFTTSPAYKAFDYTGLATSPVDTELDLYKQGSGTITQAAQRIHLWTSINGIDGISRYIQGTVGTAKMGTDDGRSNGTAVVDLDTKVYGTDNLFVVDASIHHDLPTGNTQAIIMVVSEHAAARIAAYDVVTGTAAKADDDDEACEA
ncbi:hypothetical protein BOTCAL_0036g00330 [Botryotinia calthae]|uniref:Glucose-methanol-choline oxidoreductase N-terminal domain-containing protein n=1 Tax=Botryotinia calthae TaxID=38488 RepID=A0A4Y8DFA3_9HELO|nr:hypothetical protein BOTCAL_0036g00330 [Botryotinia calthae]